jgi:hypothetical protein
MLHLDFERGQRAKVFHGTNSITCANSVLPTFIQCGLLPKEQISHASAVVPCHLIALLATGRYHNAWQLRGVYMEPTIYLTDFVAI